ncbi:MAG: DUF1499 domain-containing protein [Pirellulaceae bacterium]
MIAIWIVVGVAAGLLLLLIGSAALTIDDWSRDLATNHAATSENADDEALRPVHAKLSVSQLAALVKQSAEELPRWELAEEVSGQGEVVRLNYVRTTALLRFRDDITVTISPEGEGSLITAESQSRVGKGDLGQNPRNLRELLGGVRRRLGPSE